MSDPSMGCATHHALLTKLPGLSAGVTPTSPTGSTGATSGLSIAYQHADAPYPLWLLRARRERPRRCAAEKRDELATFHSITSSARARRVGGTSRPSARAVLRLI